MIKKLMTFLLVIAMVCTNMVIPVTAAEDSAHAEQSMTPAFPGAEGGGKYTTGGRGGEVYEVTTLADSGPGSLRDAVSGSNRTIVFKVGGTIQLESQLRISGSNLTIAGQTAPGEGISVVGYPTSFEGDNLIIRYMRFRLGDANITEADAFGGRYVRDIMIDHSSFSWSIDEVLSPYGIENMTIQWSIIADALHMSLHAKGKHGYGGIWGGKNTSFHHNLIANNSSRNPAFDSTAGNSHDFRHNVIYNWGHYASYGGKGAVTNLVNNYYKPGPETTNVRFMNAETDGAYYIHGNVMEGYPQYTADNWAGVHTYPDYTRLDEPVAFSNEIPPVTAEQAYHAVLADAGATLPRRDAIDARIVNDVKNRTGIHLNSQNEAGGYLTFEPSYSAEADRDHDGMPDAWELAHGLDPNDPEDRNLTNAEGYTNLELYLNSIIGNGSANPEVSISYPANHAIVEAGTDVLIEAAASDSDGEIAKVEFYANGVKLGEDAIAPYSYNWQSVPDGTYYLNARAIDDSGTSTFSASIAMHANTVDSTAPWMSTDIGTPGIPGHMQLGSNAAEVTVKSAGDIGGRADNFHYAYQTISGNAEIIAKVESVTATNDEAAAGVMFREHLEDDSPFAALMAAYVRDAQKGITLSRTAEGSNVETIRPDQNITLPYWIKMVRIGDQFTSLVSPDGVSWDVIGEAVVEMPATIYVGLAADAAKANNETNRYQLSDFSQVAITELDEQFPTSPQGVTAVSGDKQNVISWDAVSTATSYTVYSSIQAGGPYEPVAAGITDTTFTHTGLTAGMAYYYVVTAANHHGESLYSTEVSSVAGGDLETIYYLADDYESMAVGTTPEHYIITPTPQDTDHTVKVVEVPDSSSGNASAKALHIYDNAPGQTMFQVDFPSQYGTVVMELDFMSPALPGTSALLHVKDANGSRTPIAIEVRKPQLPEQEDTYTLIYKNQHGQDVKLSEPPEDNVWHRVKVVANVAARTMDIYVNDRLAAEQVVIRDDMRERGLGSLYIGRTPGTGRGQFYIDNVRVYVEPVASPKGLSALPGNGQVQLQWPTTNGALAYNIFRSETDGGPYERIASDVDASETTYTDTTVVNETTYYYVITAVGELGESGYSNQVIATPSIHAVKPPAPAALEGTGSHTQAELTWQAVEHAVFYTVKRSENRDGPFVAVDQVKDTMYRDTGLQNGTLYHYTVSATSVAGEGEDSEAIGIRPVAPLAAPTGLAATAGDREAVLSWQPVEGATAYQVKRSLQKGGPYTVIADQISGTTYVDQGLENGVVYEYVVLAVSEQDETFSIHSESAHVIPYGANQLPSPSDIKLSASESDVRLSWDAVSGARSYTIKRSDRREGPYTVIAASVIDSTYRDTDVVPGRTYYYTISSNDANGEGVGSYPLAATPAPIIVVAQDGSGDFTTVQAAIDSIPDGNTDRVIIYIRNGIYEEQVTIPRTKHAISFIGEDKEQTVITYTGITGTGFNERATAVESDDFTAENLTFANGAGTQGVAVALDMIGDRAYLNNVRLIGYQDTFLTHSEGKRIYVTDSYIEGAVDFIYGPAIAVFDRSIIYNVRSGGYVTAASTPEYQEFGYLFINSKITGDPGLENVYLGRPWRPFAHVVFMNSEMDSLVHDVGWHNWGNADNERTARYYEYHNHGPGADPNERVSWAKQLTPEEANKYTVHAMMRGQDGWDPTMMPVLPDPKQASEETPPSITDLLALIDHFQATGDIANHGIANSLRKKVLAGSLNSFVNQVRAQSGKHISQEAADQLIQLAEQLMNP